MAVRDPIPGVSRHRQQFWNRGGESLDSTNRSGCRAFGKGVYSTTMAILQRALNSVQFPPFDRIALAPLFTRRA